MTMREYLNRDKVTNEQVQRKVLDFVEERKDVVVIGAWAVNLQAEDQDERMTVDIDLLTTEVNLCSMLIAYIIAHLGVRLELHSEYEDVVRLFVKGVNHNKPIVDIVIGEAPYEIVEGLKVATLDWLIKAKERAIASPQRSEIKKLMDRRDVLVLREEMERRQKERKENGNDDFTGALVS